METTSASLSLVLAIEWSNAINPTLPTSSLASLVSAKHHLNTIQTLWLRICTDNSTNLEALNCCLKIYKSTRDRLTYRNQIRILLKLSWLSTLIPSNRLLLKNRPSWLVDQNLIIRETLARSERKNRLTWKFKSQILVCSEEAKWRAVRWTVRG